MAPAERTLPAARTLAGTLVVGRGNPVAADYAAHARTHGGPPVRLVDAAELHAAAVAPSEAVVVFLERRLSQRARTGITALAAHLATQEVAFVAIVSSYRVHLSDCASAEVEEFASQQLGAAGRRVVIFRPGQITSQASLRRLGSCYPLVPTRCRGCFVDAAALFAAIDAERQRNQPARRRTITLLGPNRPWREVLREQRMVGPLAAVLLGVSWLLSLLLVGQLAALVVDLLARWLPGCRRWNVGMLQPTTFQELLALYNPHNFQHVKVVGYNNGVVHFGHGYPTRTLVKTTALNRIVRLGPDALKVDAGVTIRQAMEYLTIAGQTLPVVPNYSYVCLGTAFFVPIHGSAAAVTTVAETIEQIVLYDPRLDRVIVAQRDDPAFREHLYRLDTDVLVLRLNLRVQAQAAYVLERQHLDAPDAPTLLAAMRNPHAANVEIRKGAAASSAVEVCRYFTDPARAQGPTLAVPRDALGSLWDRLEANPITSFLFHFLVRRYAWHVELFLTPSQFETFWQSHRWLPIRKIQLRYIRRDGCPHSPFRDSDCVSADMFMLRRHREQFEAYLRETIPQVRLNPGKHSA